MRSYWLRVGPDVMTAVLIRGGGRDTDIHTAARGPHLGKTGRDWSDASMS